MYKIKEIIEKFGGKLFGDENLIINGFSQLNNADVEKICFYTDEKYKPDFLNTKAGCVVVSKYYPEVKIPQIVIENTELYFAKIIKLFHKNPYDNFTGMEDGSFIKPTAKIAENVFVGRGSYLSDDVKVGEQTKILQNVFIGKNTIIGKNCLIYPNVTIRENIKIGNNVIIHPGVVIGSDGFGYAKDGVKNIKIEQTGSVELEDDVEIGANTAIDRSTLGVTRIGKGTKIDNLVHVAHNVEIGENCFICGQVGIAGSVKIGNNVTLAGQVGVSGHIEIGDNIIAGGQAGIVRSLRSNQIVSGYPARPHEQARKVYAIMNHLPEIYETVKKLKKMFLNQNEEKKTTEEDKLKNG